MLKKEIKELSFLSDQVGTDALTNELNIDPAALEKARGLVKQASKTLLAALSKEEGEKE